MYDEESEFSAVARTSNLNEELGQVSFFIFWFFLPIDTRLLFFSSFFRFNMYLVIKRVL